MRRLTHSAASLLTLVLSLVILPQPALAKYSGGIGEPNNPYRIATSNDLNDIGNHVEDFNKCFVMTNDINLAQYTGMQFNIIGDDMNAFAGVFDGKDYSILNFTYDTTGEYYIGLFGHVSDVNAEIRDLRLVGADVNAGSSDMVGSLIGFHRDAAVVRCSAVGTVVSGDDAVGGLIGSSAWGKVSDCSMVGAVLGDADVGGLIGRRWGVVSGSWADCNVSGGNMAAGLIGQGTDADVHMCWSSGLVNGQQYVGGLMGDHFRGYVACSYSTANVEGQDFVGGLAGRGYGPITECCAFGDVCGVDSVGGLVGFATSSGYGIYESYATGCVSGREQVGGLVGWNNLSPVSNCYATGLTIGDTNMGGLIGENAFGHAPITACFWDVNTSGQTTSDGGTGLTTTEMQTQSTFTDAGWDFNDVWAICEGTNYPKLSWSIPAADFLCPDGVNFVDYSFFADWWLTESCGDANDCEGADFDLSGAIDESDLRSFSVYWLSGLD